MHALALVAVVGVLRATLWSFSFGSRASPADSMPATTVVPFRPVMSPERTAVPVWS